MRQKRPQDENAYLMETLRPILERMKDEPELVPQFVAFATKALPSLDHLKFGMRLYHSLGRKDPRPPSAVMAVLLLRFEATLPRATRRRTR